VIVPDAALKQEIEEGKQAGLVEKRGLGRRVGRLDIETGHKSHIERLDNLMNLVGELVVNRNRLVQQVDFIKSVREELAFSQKRLLHEVKKFESTSTPPSASVQQAAAGGPDFQELGSTATTTSICSRASSRRSRTIRTRS
jgi:chemotaxis protein histidine kinase CheA